MPTGTQLPVTKRRAAGTRIETCQVQGQQSAGRHATRAQEAAGSGAEQALGQRCFLRAEFGLSLGNDRPMTGAWLTAEPAFAQGIADQLAYWRFLVGGAGEYNANPQRLPGPDGD